MTILDLIKEDENKKIEFKEQIKKICKKSPKISNSIELMFQEKVIARRVLNGLTNKGVIIF